MPPLKCLSLGAAFVGCAAALAPSVVSPSCPQRPLFTGSTSSGFKCDLPEAIDPSADGLRSADELFSSREALKRQVDRHRAIVRVPTICFDDMGPLDEDPRWEPFGRLHDALKKTYPVV